MYGACFSKQKVKKEFQEPEKREESIFRRRKRKRERSRRGNRIDVIYSNKKVADDATGETERVAESKRELHSDEKLMGTDRKRITPTSFLRAVTAAACAMVVRCHYALNHSVGESFWSIPPSEDFYSKWSANHFFRVGDSLVFEFETNFHDVIQVSKRHYENCCTERPLRTFRTGPATVTLPEVGVYYFICSVANYCLLGQKLSVAVHSLIPAPPLQQPPPFSPSLSPAWPPHPSSPPVDPTSPAPAHGNLPVPSSSAPATKTRPVVQPSESPALIRSCSARFLNGHPHLRFLFVKIILVVLVRLSG